MPEDDLAAGQRSSRGEPITVFNFLDESRVLIGALSER